MIFCTCSLSGGIYGLYSPITLFLNCATAIEISNATVYMMQTPCLGSSHYIFLSADLGGYHYNTYNIHNLWWFAVPYQNLLDLSKASVAKCSPFDNKWWLHEGVNFWLLGRLPPSLSWENPEVCLEPACAETKCHWFVIFNRSVSSQVSTKIANSVERLRKPTFESNPLFWKLWPPKLLYKIKLYKNRCLV